jgi:hypothetical protein
MSGLYLNDTPMEIRLRTGLRHNLERIRQVDGYFNDLRLILDDPPEAPNKIQDFPAVVIVFGEEKNTSESIDLQELTLQAFLYCHLRAAESPSVAVAKLKADIQLMLGRYYPLPGADGVPTCGRAKYASSLPFARLNGAPACGTRIGLKITYQQLTQDPSQN